MKVTLKQIAERTGVSINTVSMVLRGMSGISAPTRERVRRAAEEMGYRRQLKPAATKQSLCLVSAERHRRDSYSYTEFNRIFMSYAAAHEFSVVTAEAEQFRDDPEGAQRRIEEAGVGGILTLGDIDETLFSRLRRCGLPIVSVGARYYREPVCTFTEDNEMAAHQVVHALMERGFTRIGLRRKPAVQCGLFRAVFRAFGSPAIAPVSPCRRETNGLTCFRALTARRRKTASCGIWSRIKACRRCFSAETTCLR